MVVEKRWSLTRGAVLLACVAGGIRERASGGGAAIFSRRSPARDFAIGEAASGIQLDSSTILSRLRHSRS